MKRKRKNFEESKILLARIGIKFSRNEFGVIINYLFFSLEATFPASPRLFFVVLGSRGTNLAGGNLEFVKALFQSRVLKCAEQGPDRISGTRSRQSIWYLGSHLLVKKKNKLKNNVFLLRLRLQRCSNSLNPRGMIFFFFEIPSP